MKKIHRGYVRLNKNLNYIPFSEDKSFFDCKIFNGEDQGEVIQATLVLSDRPSIMDRIEAVLNYCRPHQEYMWAKYITAILENKKDWRD